MKPLTNPFIFFSFIVYFFLLSDPVWTQQSDRSAVPYNNSFCFLKNMGQWDDKILYQSKLNNGITARFLKNGISFLSCREVNEHNLTIDQDLNVSELIRTDGLVWNLKFENANDAPSVLEEKEQPGNINYLMSFAPEKWIKNIPQFASITYRNIYNNIDLKYYGTEKGLKYDYILHSGSSASSIRTSYQGIEKLSISESGALLIKTAWGIVEEEAPFAYQLINNTVHEVKVKYHLYDNHTFGFLVNQSYDHNYDLIIDPFFHVWGTYLGGYGYSFDIDKDGNDNLFASGLCNPFTFPVTPGAYMTSGGGGFITKISRDGSSQVYSTLFPGTCQSIAVNNAGEVHVTGVHLGNVFIAKLNSAGNGLLYYNSLGGSAVDCGTGIALDKSTGEVYTTGYTYSADFPVTPLAFQGTLRGASDAFAVKLDALGNVVYSTYLGGTGAENIRGPKELIGDVFVRNGEMYIVGITNSPDFPIIPGAFQPAYGGGNWDGFITHLNTNGTSVISSTFLGGTADDLVRGITINNTGEIFVTGTSTSANFPTSTGSIQTTIGGNSDAFASRLNASGTNLIYSTFIGGSAYDEAYGIAVNCENEVYISGFTASANFPINGAYQTTNRGSSDFFVSVVNSSGQSFLGSTYMGGVGADYFQPHIILMSETCGADTIAFNGTSHSTNSPAKPFPATPGAFRTDNSAGGDDDPVILKMVFSKNRTISPGVSICKGSSTQLSAGGGSSYSWSPAAGLNNPTTDNPIATPSVTTTYVVTMGCLACKDSVTIIVNSAPVITFSTSSNVCTGGATNISAMAAGAGGYSYLWFPTGSTTPSITTLAAGTYSVLITDVNGCTSLSSTNILPPPAPVTVSITSASNVSCFGGNDGYINTTVNGGISNYSYLWSNSMTGNNISGLVSGVYSLTVTDGNGCTATTFANIISPPPLVGSINSQINPNCNGNNNGIATCTVAGGMPGYTYSWNVFPVQNTATVTGLPAGTYTAVITDMNGCSISVSASITQPPPITLSITTAPSNCNLPDGSALLSASGGTGSFNYLWNSSPVQITNNPTGLSAGVYSVTVTDVNGCSAISRVNISNNPGVAIQSIHSSSVSCFGLCNGSATVTGSAGTAPYTYQWSNGQNTANATLLCSGLYTCTVMDNAGCSDTISINVSEPLSITAAIITSDPSCFGDNNGTVTVSPAGGIPGYTYNWNNGQISSSATGLPSGAYTVSVTDANGCSITTSSTLNDPSQLVANISGNMIVCAGQAASLTVSALGGTGTYSYNWSTGNNAVTINFSAVSASVYSCTVTDSNNCTTVTTTNVNIHPPTQVTFTADDTTGCSPLCVYFNNTTPNSVSSMWNYGDGNTSFTNSGPHCYTDPGVYSVSLTVVDINGCNNTTIKPDYITVFPNPTAAFLMNPQTFLTTSSVITFSDKSHGATQWEWYFGDVGNSLSTNQNPQFTYQDTGSFTVQLVITNEYGCSDTAIQLLNILSEFIVYVPNTFTPNGDEKNDMFFPMGTGIDWSAFEMWIFDRWGNLIFRTTNINNGWNGKANGGTDVAQQDTYVWKINIKDIFGQQYRLIGNVNLIR